MSLQYSVPLLKNIMGNLYLLETAYLKKTDEARLAESDYILIERCASAIDIYTVAFKLQKSVEVWTELKGIKEKT